MVLSISIISLLKLENYCIITHNLVRYQLSFDKLKLTLFFGGTDVMNMDCNIIGYIIDLSKLVTL